MPTLVVSYSGLFGGAERLLLDVLPGFREPPELACPEGPLAQAAREAGLGVFPLRTRSLELRRSLRDRVAAPARTAAQAAEVRALVRSARADVVVAWGMRAALSVGPALSALRSPPAFLFQHSDLLPGPAIARAVCAVARRADLVVAISAAVARDLDPRGELGARMVVLRPGVDLERFRPGPPGAGRDQEALLLGAIEPWKRPDLALEAVAHAAREAPETRLRVAGEPIGAAGERLFEQLRERAARRDLDGRVELAGRVGDPAAALREAGCLLHCAEREPYGMVVAEALASGLPVVAPAAFGPSEIGDETCACLYPPGDAAAAGDALAEVLGDPEEARAMGTRARELAERRLDVRETRARYGELLEGLSPSPPRALPSAGEGMALVTVTHDSERDLEALLASVERHLPAARVVVVDSGSSDRSVEVARAWEGNGEVIELGENVGFGRGTNAGLAVVEEPVTVVLNPDVELLDSSLAAIAREALRPPERLLAPLVVRPDGSRQDSAQREPGAPPMLVHALVPGAALPQAVAAAVEPWRARGPRRAGWAVGCCLAARTETLRRLGPFDERVFLYGEDLDLGLRAGDVGVETWFWPAARVLHKETHAAIREFGGEPFELLARRRREVVAERRGTRRARRDDRLQRLTFADRLTLKAALGRDTRRERRQLAALDAARRGE